MREHRFLVAEQMRQINTEPKSIILEPFGRNTLPAVALSAFKLHKEGDDNLMLILPSDHVIKNNEKFIEVILKSAELAEKDNIITFGVKQNMRKQVTVISNLKTYLITKFAIRKNLKIFRKAKLGSCKKTNNKKTIFHGTVEYFCLKPVFS